MHKPITSSSTREDIIRQVALEEAKERWDAAEFALGKFVIPLYHADGPEKLIHSGSSVILQIGNRFFLVTAGHVLEPINCSDMYLNVSAGVGSPVSKLRGRVFMTSSRNEDHSDDHIDLGIVELIDEQVAAIKNSDLDVIALSNVDLSHETNERKYYSFVGYPTSRVKIRRYSQQIIAKSLLHTTSAVKNTMIKHLEKGLFRSDDNIGITIGRSISKETGQAVNIPSLPGISGGGLWRVQDLTSWEGHSEVPVLVGIIVERDPKYPIILKATRMSCVINMILNIDPSLAQHFKGVDAKEYDLTYYEVA